MRYVEIPANVEIEHMTIEATGKHPDVSFENFVRRYLVMHQDVAKKADVFDALARGVKNMKIGDIWEISKEEHELLQELAQTHQWPQDIKLAVLPFISAIKRAPHTDPRLKVKPAAEPVPAEA